MLEFVDSDLYFVQDKNNFINPLLQVGSGSVEKSIGSGSGGPNITGSGSSSLVERLHYISVVRGSGRPKLFRSDRILAIAKYAIYKKNYESVDGPGFAISDYQVISEIYTARSGPLENHPDSVHWYRNTLNRIWILKDFVSFVGCLRG